MDYRNLNSVIVNNHFPVPTVEKLLDELFGAKIFSKIDLRASYHQIRIALDHTHKTAFQKWKR
ncbi:putative nucleotidyltransferase, Ribonuclease H [Lupinus albus]|uniref:Putative nucleotidyltransferase, Ribonuclease H n=1 Tax=Lupinus albus TaxID=3870 RepID=A0A6A4PVE3_LUPAL|nr:putative nucleotidyltransferase, Ribonuclease H [Lupinus albus]